MASDTEARVQQIISNLRSLDKARELFAELNYDPAHDLISRKGWGETIANTLAEDPQVIASHEDFKIIYARLDADSLLLGDERPVVNRLLNEYPYLLCLFSDSQQQQWHFVNIRYDEEIKKRRLFRRITVGPGERLRTATERLSLLDLERIRPDLVGIYPLDIQTHHDEAFDVEAVTKDFYNTFVDLFHLLKDEIASNNPTYRDEAPIEAQMILNRLLFLYFIQKKQWLDNNPHYLYERFREHYTKDPSGYTFYSDFLIRLFQRLSNEELEFKDLGDVPFLNGGLFETEPFHSKLPFDLKISNRTFRTVFERLLEHFNFTVREDTPVDVEVAIDPEMLGRIFENLILQFERDRDLRKMTGSYYTPRVIVHFMCQQSLKEYLALESQIDPAKLEMLLELNPPDQLEDWEVDLLKDIVSIPEARTLRDAAKRVFVLDPAVGSGAFLVGMLHEVLTLIKHMDIREHGPEYIARRNYAYELKRDIIESCLYGVDILEQAVRICELRLWLSLVVDYEKELEEEVPPLPNLSYQVKQGDSLIETLFGQRVRLDALTRTEKGRQLIDEIQQEKHAYFLTRNLRRKRQKELDILVKQCELSEILVKEKKQTLGTKQRLFGEMTDKEAIQSEEVRKQAATFDNLLHSAQKAKQKAHAWLDGKLSHSTTDINKLRQELGISFVWQLDFAEVFKEKEGFDVVIGNPPWITMRGKQRMDISDSEVEYYKKVYINSAEYKINTFAIFTEKSIHLLRPGGIFSFIMPNTILRNQYLSKIRKYILGNTEIRYILDLGGSVFQASIADSAVLVFIKTQEPNLTRSFEAYYCIENLEKRSYKCGIFEARDFLSNPNCEYNIDIDKIDMNLIKKIEDGSCPFKRYLKNYVGVVTGDNKKYISRTKINEKYREILVGEDIKKYRYQFNSRYVFFDKDVLWSNTDERVFTKNEKILLRKTGSVLIAAYDDKKYFTEQTVYNLYFKEPCQHDLRYFLALLNSRLMQYYFSKKLITNPDSFPYIKGIHIDVLPAREIDFSNLKEKNRHDHIIRLVDDFIRCYEQHKESSPNGTAKRIEDLERQIDQQVYELYGLTDEEIVLIEKSM